MAALVTGAAAPRHYCLLLHSSANKLVNLHRNLLPTHSAETLTSTQNNAKGLSRVISTPLGWDVHKHLLQFGLLSRQDFPNTFPWWLGLLPELMEYLKKSIQTFRPTSKHRLTIGMVSRAPAPQSCFLAPFTHTCTNTLLKHRDTIEWGLWAQFVYFNGQVEAPNLTTGRPLRLRTCEKISVKSHQGFNSLWPRCSFPPCLQRGSGLWINRVRMGCTLSYICTASLGGTQTSQSPASLSLRK